MSAGFSRVTVALAALLLSAPLAHASPIFSLLPPDGTIQGTPGSTIGWGYTIGNDTDLWLEVTSLTSDPFQNATADGSLFDYPILRPFTTLRVPYDPAAFAGLFQITWDLTAPDGFTNTGVFTLSSAFWDADPFLGGNFELAADQTAAYAATVVATVPEPGTLLVTSVGVALAGALHRRRRGRHSIDTRGRP